MSPQSKKFRVRVVTFNVAGTSPSEDLREFLGLDGRLDEYPDILAVGLQEVSLNPVNLINSKLSEEFWARELRLRLKSLDYTKMISYHLMGLFIVVFARTPVIHDIRDIVSEAVRTGFGGYFGNKGAVVVSMVCGDRSFCFVNSHLAAHDHELKRRIQDIDTISAGLRSSKIAKSLHEFDYVFFFGDLNFRLDESVSMSDIRDSIARNRSIEEILQHDQLNDIIGKRQALIGFKEWPVTFRPTFKFKAGTSNYNTTKRRPAWTDRILHFSAIDGDIVQTSYASHENYQMSDHKPVSANFEIDKIVLHGKPKVNFLVRGAWTDDAPFELCFEAETDFHVDPNDWIGLFETDFDHLDNYLAYIWVGRTPEPSLRPRVDASDSTLRKMYTRAFCDQICLTNGHYRLVYFRNQCDVLGISDPLEVIPSDNACSVRIRYSS